MSDVFASVQTGPTKDDYIHEEKVVHPDRKFLSQHEMLVLEKSASTEPASSQVLEQDLAGKSKIFDERTERRKSLKRRLLQEEIFESHVDHDLPSARFRALKFRDRAELKHSVGTIPLQRNDEILQKPDQAKYASLTCLNFKNCKFESSEGKHSTEAERAERIEELFSRRESGNRGMDLQDVYEKLNCSSTPSVKSKKKSCNEIERMEKQNDAQREVQKDSEQLKVVINNLVSAVAYSFQNALALKQQHGQQIDKSFLTFFLRREVRKMFLIKELIKELETVTSELKFHEDDSKNISETVESLHSLMCQDVKNPDEEGITESESKENQNYPRVVTTFAIISCVVVVLGLAVVFIENWSAVIPAIIVFIFTTLVSFCVITQMFKLKRSTDVKNS